MRKGLIYAQVARSDTTAFAGRNTALSRAYLMGNHVIAERMYRHDAGVMMYASLRVEIFEDEAGSAVFSAEKPSAALGSFGNDEIAAAGVELDHKPGGLLAFLAVPVPELAGLR